MESNYWMESTPKGVIVALGVLSLLLFFTTLVVVVLLRQLKKEKARQINKESELTELTLLLKSQETQLAAQEQKIQELLQARTRQRLAQFGEKEHNRRNEAYLKVSLYTWFMSYFNPLYQMLQRSQLAEADYKILKTYNEELGLQIEDAEAELLLVQFIEIWKTQPILTAIARFCEYKGGDRVTIHLYYDDVNPRLRFNPDWQGALLRVLHFFTKASFRHLTTLEVSFTLIQTPEILRLVYTDKGNPIGLGQFMAAIDLASDILLDLGTITELTDGISLEIPLPEEVLQPQPQSQLVE